MDSEAIKEYIDYVVSQLDQLPQYNTHLSAYDTGFGVTIAEDVGPRLPNFALLAERIIHIKEPTSAIGYKGTSEEWTYLWNVGKSIVDTWLDQHNFKVDMEQGA